MVRYLGICLLVLSASAAVGAEPKELLHEGKPVSQWLTQLSSKDRTERDRAADAVIAIVKTDVPRVTYGKYVTRRAPEVVSDSLLLAQPELIKEHAAVMTPLLVKMLKDEEALTRVSAARVLVLMGAKADAAIPALKSALEDDSWDVRRYAAVALAQADPKQVEPMVAFLLKAPASQVHYRRIAPCWEDETPLPALGAAAIPTLVPALAHEDAAVRERAARSLCLMGEPAVEGTIKALSAESPALRAAAARCLARMSSKTPGWQEALRGALRDSEREVRLTAAESLGKAEVDATIPVLLDALTEGAGEQRARAAFAIRSLGDAAQASAKSAAPRLEKRLQTRNDALDLDVADVLVFLDPARAKSVARLLDRPTVTTQDEVQVLVRIGHAAPAAVPQVVSALAGIVKQSSKGVAQQCAAAQSVGQFGPAAKAAVPALIEAAKGKNEQLKKIASRILPSIDPEELDYPRDLQSPPYNPNEAIRSTFSLTKAAEYMDVAGQDWMRTKSCGGCHANFAYMMVRPLLKTETAVVADSRKFLDDQVENHGRERLIGIEVTAAAALAFDDGRTGQLRPTTRKALDRMWSVLPISSCNSDNLVVELSPDFTAALAIVAADVAPEKYAQTDRAKTGLAATRDYLRKSVKANNQASLHSKALLLWAAAHDRDLLTAAEREAIVQALLAAQNADGGWSLASIEGNARPSKKSKDPASDGYSTGLIVYVLRQAGVPASQAEIGRGVTWLRSNQRASGRWFTPSTSAGRITSADFGTRDFYSQNMGTAFALLALESCGALQTAETTSAR